MKLFVYLYLSLMGPLALSMEQCHVDYYNPKAENFKNQRCKTKSSKRTVASVKKVPIDYISSIEKELANQLHAADINFDGKPDFFRKWRNGKLLSISYDSNGDGKVDFQYLLTNKELIQQEKMDRNLDGLWDYIKTYKKNGNFSIKLDKDFNQSFDEVHYYSKSKNTYKKHIKKLKSRSIASTDRDSYKPNKRNYESKSKSQFLIPKVEKFKMYNWFKDPTEGDACLECYAKNINSFYTKENIFAITSHLFEFELKWEGDFFKSNGMLIHKTCIDPKKIKVEGETEEERADFVHAELSSIVGSIFECYYALLEETKGRVTALNTGHIPNFLATLGVIKGSDGRPIYNHYPDRIASLPKVGTNGFIHSEQASDCIKRQKRGDKVKCYLQDEIKIVCNLDPTATPYEGTTESRINKFPVGDTDYYMTHPAINISSFSPTYVFHEIQRAMGYGDALNLQNAYTQACDAACLDHVDIELSEYVDKEIEELAKKVCLADPLSHETCEYFIDLNKVLRAYKLWQDSFITEKRMKDRKDKQGNIVPFDSDWRTERKHIERVCKNNPGAVEEIYAPYGKKLDK